MSPLKLTCIAQSSSDYVRAGQYAPAKVVIAVRDTSVSEHETTIYLDKARARELFNWLGVWLHRS